MRKTSQAVPPELAQEYRDQFSYPRQISRRLVMDWRIPLLQKTLNSLKLSSQHMPAQHLVEHNSKLNHEAAKDRARQRLDRADAFSDDQDLTQQFG